ncbi:uncharacterized protein LOC107813259 isoform X1 [Nicotiana tabacum]|uniref:Uncharacterized protein isoform X1 n=3 Tax=Nicotiana TaxID=4085 RepID=A0A1S4BYL0_TOBAC|nr:PREDICTED: uncharacterized protein LOC104231363 isoform X1 [Nicotiana sylvestris]XP_009782647.1 PREDICTED: uncharacterized protein LOC104231363 isoform X1 [Nicotiana sylvestris]XP_009782648.1 PREDICTED: uncharacterized protein LOC104231363 isoform X1 [Nicotiana sylvestris]XP_009782649.1 PREDICTED: uncharacterized protein LOC104231363 isoform X1 [Nicotiana sylvestris]XP_016493985.1 PREDICTED: uncharacterized protein LOC107813259 isoform X1 [Nicotiana tabacum]XP_016493986.1 PREDICTED: unchara
MGRPGLRSCGVSAEYLCEQPKLDISDNIRLVQHISRSQNVDENYAEFLKFLYNYDINSQSYTNEHGHDGSADVVGDEADPQYQIFLANAKPDGKSYVLKVDSEDGVPVLIKYENECGCNHGCECLHRKKQKDMEMQKDPVDEKNLLSSIKSLGDVDAIFEPVDPISKRKLGIVSRKRSTEKQGASKRQGKSETKIRSGEEKMMEKGSKSVNVTGKEEASDVEEDYRLILENLQCKNWGLKALLRSGTVIEYEAVEDDVEILYNNSGTLNKINVRSKFRQKVMDLLKKPYDQNEYEELWSDVNAKKPVLKHMDLRNGKVKFYGTQKMGKSYLDHHEDLQKRLKEVDNDNRKKLKILRGFFFWLQNLTHKESFIPWKDAEFLSRAAESS